MSNITKNLDTVAKGTTAFLGLGGAAPGEGTEGIPAGFIVPYPVMEIREIFVIDEKPSAEAFKQSSAACL